MLSNIHIIVKDSSIGFNRANIKCLALYNKVYYLGTSNRNNSHNIYPLSYLRLPRFLRNK